MNLETEKHAIHQNHTHSHGKNCGHKSIQHDSHTGFLHDGHLHCLHEGHVDEHRIELSALNPATCTPDHDCKKHAKDHKHGSNCGHDSIPHGDHIDYLVEGHLHHAHGSHCDDHGKIQEM